MAEADIRAEANPAMADRARHRPIRGRVMAAAVVAPARPQAAAEVTSVAAEDMHPAVEAEAIPVVAVTPVEVAGIPAITRVRIVS
jgi:hypothetical protein